MNRPSLLDSIMERRLLIAGLVVGVVFLLGIGYALGSGSSSHSSAPTANVLVAPDVAPTATPASATVVATQPATTAPAATPTTTAAPTGPEANRADCDKIRGSDYLSETEHAWFIANCTGSRAPTPAPASQTPAAGASTGGASTGGASTATTDPVAALARVVRGITSYRATLVVDATGIPTQNWRIEAALPNRYHIDGGVFEVILIGGDTYLKYNGAWSKQPEASIPNLGQVTDMNVLLQGANFTVQGTDSINGKSCQLFVSGEATLCVDANYTPLRFSYAVSGFRATVFFTEINGAVSIAAPI